MALFIAPAVAAGAVAAAAAINNNVLPQQVQNYGDQFVLNRKKGIMLSAYKAPYTIWGPGAFSPLEAPNQDVVPGDVTTVQRDSAKDFTNMQNGQIEYNFRTRTGRLPLGSNQFVPQLINVISTTRQLPVKGGDTLVNNPLTTTKRMVPNQDMQVPDFGTTIGIAGSDGDARKKSPYVKSFLVDRRNPFAPGGAVISLTKQNQLPADSSNALPKVLLIDPTNSQPGQTRKVLAFQK